MNIRSGYGITDTPNMLEDYIITDSADIIPYFMLTDKSPNANAGIGPKFFSWSKDTSQYDSWGYQRPANRIVNHTNNYWHGSDRPLKMNYIYRGDMILFHTSLFMMQEERGETNILLSGVIKEEDLFIIKEMLTQNDINVGSGALTTLAPFIEIWVADDFDVVKSRFHQVRNLYRRRIRRSLIDKGLRIRLKPRAEMNELLIKRKVKFETLDLLQNKITNLCQTAASSEVNQLSSPST